MPISERGKHNLKSLAKPTTATFKSNTSTVKPVLSAINDKTAKLPFPIEMVNFGSLPYKQLQFLAKALLAPSTIPTQIVSLANLIGTNEIIDLDVLSNTIESNSSATPIVIRLNNKEYILQGHHNLTAAFLRKEEKVAVKVIDLPVIPISAAPVDSLAPKDTKEGPLTANAYFGDTPLPPIVINLTLTNPAPAITKRTITTSRDADGNLVANVSDNVVVVDKS
jgi:hypothetical protein